MTQTEWHAGGELLARYAAGELDDIGQAAVETHVTGCQSCRDEANRLTAPPVLELAWQGVATAIAAPPLPAPLRMLRRFGVQETDLVVLRASANLVVPLALALIAAVTFAVIATYLSTDDQRLFYLAIAPLLPVLLVTAAYDTTDPMREVGDVTPFSQLRVALLRTAVSVSGALPPMLLMALVPSIDLSLGAWLLPSLTLAVVTLAMLTWLSANTTVTAVSVTWLAAVTTMKANGSLAFAGSSAGQAVFVPLLLLSAAVFAGRLGLLPMKGERS